MANILIAGGSGLIGNRLSEILKEKGHEVCWLSRKPNGDEPFVTYKWNPSKKEIDPTALKNCDAIISLSGTPIASSRWTSNFKREVIESRTRVAETLIHALRSYPHRIECIVAASAIGYYGSRGDEILNEDSPSGAGFLAETTKRWEDAYMDSPVRVVNLRIGIVLSAHGGAMKELAAPLKFGVCPVIGNGDQYMSWVHIDDLCRMFDFAIENKSMSGKYNAVAPDAMRHRDFMKVLRKVISPMSLVVPAPAFILKMILGEKSAIVLDSTRVSPDKIVSAGFSFQYTTLDSSLHHLYEK